SSAGVSSIRARRATYRTSKFAADMGRNVAIEPGKGNPLKHQRHKLQIPNSKLQRSTRSQTPNTKLQTPEKLQAPSSKRGPRFGTWDFFGDWSLVFGVSIPGFLWSLGFGAWCFAPRLPKNEMRPMLPRRHIWSVVSRPRT